MKGVESLLFFVMVPAAVTMLGESLYGRAERVHVLFFLLPIVGIAGGLTIGQADGSLGSILSISGFLYCTSLSLLGFWDPVRYFWAFRALSAGIFTGLAVDTVLATVVGPEAAVIGKTIGTVGSWIATIVLGLPCLWFANRRRERPSRQRLHVFMNPSAVPPLTLWQGELHRWGFDLALSGVDNLNLHAGWMEVVLQGKAVGFQFDVAPLEQLIEDGDITEGNTGRLDDNSVAANFRYADESERVAALIAAAALTKLSGGRMYTLDPETWIDGDDAIETAQDALQPHELHVLLMEERVPTLEQWQQALQPADLAFEIETSTDLRKHAGYLPVVDQGHATGFVFSLLPADFVVGGDRFPGAEAPREVFRLTESANFRFAEGPAAAAAARAAAAFARIADGIVFDPQRMVFLGSDGTVLTPPPPTDDGTD